MEFSMSEEEAAQALLDLCLDGKETEKQMQKPVGEPSNTQEQACSYQQSPTPNVPAVDSGTLSEANADNTESTRTSSISKSKKNDTPKSKCHESNVTQSPDSLEANSARSEYVTVSQYEIEQLENNMKTINKMFLAIVSIFDKRRKQNAGEPWVRKKEFNAQQQTSTILNVVDAGCSRLSEANATPKPKSQQPTDKPGSSHETKIESKSIILYLSQDQVEILDINAKIIYEGLKALLPVVILNKGIKPNVAEPNITEHENVDTEKIKGHSGEKQVNRRILKAEQKVKPYTLRVRNMPAQIPKNVKANNDDLLPIGNGNAMVPPRVLKTIDWSSYTIATRKLLEAIFPRSVLATHSLTGKPSPAFLNRPPKEILDPKLVDDIIKTVAENCGVEKNLVRQCITIKCSDEAKLYRNRQKNQEVRQSQHENGA